MATIFQTATVKSPVDEEEAFETTGNIYRVRFHSGTVRYTHTYSNDSILS